MTAKLRKFLQILLEKTVDCAPASFQISGKCRRKFHAFGVNRGNDSDDQKHCTQYKRSKHDNDSQKPRQLFAGKPTDNRLQQICEHSRHGDRQAGEAEERREFAW